MRRSTGVERFEQEAEPRPRGLRVYPKQLEDSCLEVGIVDSDASAAELRSIEYDVVCKRRHDERVRIEQCPVIRVRRSERMMHRCQRPALRITHEEWEIRHP